MSEKIAPVDSNSWNTPNWCIKYLDDMFKFKLDVCASDSNHKFPKYFTEQDDALKQKWSGPWFCNPPYGLRGAYSVSNFVKYGYGQALEGEPGCFLIPLKTDINMYHDYIRRGKLIHDATFMDPRGKVGLEQIRETPEHIYVVTKEFRGRIAFTDDQGNVAGNGRFSSVALGFCHNLDFLA